jgi:hypothetical protein
MSAAAVAGLAIPAVVNPRRAGAPSTPIIVGSWIGDVAGVAGDRLTTLYLFSSDGTVFLTKRSHPTTGPAVGAWMVTAANAVAVTPVRMVFDMNGMYTGRHRLRYEVNLNDEGTEFSGRIARDTLGVNGNRLRSNPGRVQATRLQVESIDQPSGSRDPGPIQHHD